MKLSRHISTTQVFYICIISIIYIGTPALIFVGAIPWDMKFIALTAGTVIVYLAMRLLGSSNESLGLTTKKARQSIRDIAPMTIVLILLALVFLLAQGSRFSPSETWQFYLFYVLISAPAQELLFRGVLSHMLQAFSLPRALELAVASLAFGYVHFIYRDPLTVIVMTVVGFFWYRAYQKSGNLSGVVLSHIVLGVITIALGLVD